LAAIVVAAMLLAMTAPRAEAVEGQQAFCVNVWMDPYGSQYDNCGAWEKHWNFYFKVVSQEHSACVSATTNGWKSGLVFTWSCTSGPNGLQEIVAYPPYIETYGIIRNNTTGSGNHATGTQAFCYSYKCL
jgi:hypothetical protein